MRILIIMLVVISSTVTACSQSSSIPDANIVLLNGGIYTVDANRNWAEAAAIRDGRIVSVGSNESIKMLIGAETEVIDLDGRMAMPGFVDSHIHPLEGGYEEVYCNLWDYGSIDDELAA
jgi:predicted amidohydrolase YtcJ